MLTNSEQIPLACAAPKQVTGSNSKANVEKIILGMAFVWLEMTTKLILNLDSYLPAIGALCSALLYSKAPLGI